MDVGGNRPDVGGDAGDPADRADADGGNGEAAQPPLQAALGAQQQAEQGEDEDVEEGAVELDQRPPLGPGPGGRGEGPEREAGE